MRRREFLIAAAASGMLATVPAAFARELLEADATRNADDVRLAWTAPNVSTSIFVSSDPDAPQSYMRELKAGLRGGHTDFRLPVSPRPYFLLSTRDDGAFRVAERLLPLQGGRNFRDLGGYRAENGRQVRWGRIYRSGVMSGLTLADMTYLSALGIEVICDLRSTQERKSQPNPFSQSEAPEVVATEYELPLPTGLRNATTRTDAITAFANLYVQFTQNLAPQYADVFARLLRRETPLAFNCSAGKDRTGVAAALILSVLGVPREKVIADYALTQVYLPPAKLMGSIATSGTAPGASPDQTQAMAGMPADVMAVMMGSDPDVMRQALDQIDRTYGGPIELAKSHLGLTDAKIAYLRSVYLI